MQRLLFAFPLLLSVFIAWKPVESTSSTIEKPRICLSFDDGSIVDVPGYQWHVWNDMLLNGLKKHNLQAVLFVKGKGLTNKKGRTVLSSWDKEGHLIANHTYSHASYSDPAVSFDVFSADVMKNDSMIRSYVNYTRLFRFPYLKEGNTEEKRDAFRAFLKEKGYRNGHVTVDDSDWVINNRLLRKLRTNPKAKLKPYRDFYLQHLYDRAVYYNELSLKVTGRQISHTLLLHHNAAAALFIDDLITMFKAKGWEVIDASKAYEDEIYLKVPNTLPAGESLIWALAKETGAYEELLRYPAEDSKYEDPKMNALGL